MFRLGMPGLNLAGEGVDLGELMLEVGGVQERSKVEPWKKSRVSNVHVCKWV